MAIPTSNMPGHKELHDRVYNALDRCQESKSVDFKESAAWDNLKWQIIRTALAMGNLRDGGVIVVGASERNDTWELTGISPEHFATYDVDNIIDIINKFASPPIKVEVVTVPYRNGNIFLAIQIHEFKDSPFVCKNNCPDNIKILKAGDVFVRPPGKARTTRVISAEEMQDLLELAAEKRARRILEVAHRIGLKVTDSISKKFDDELGGLINKNETKLPASVLEYPHWCVNFRPNEYKEDLIPTLSKCFDIIEKNKLSLRGWDYPHLSRRYDEREQGNNWVASWSAFMGHHEYWRFYQSGQFIHLFSVKESTEGEYKEKLRADMKSHRIFADGEINWESVPGFFSIINFIYNITEIYEFAARLCQSEIYTSAINIQIDIKGIKGFVLTAPWERAWHSYFAASQDILTRKHKVDGEQLISASKDISLESIVWFFERFGWLEPSKTVIRQDQEKLIKGRF